MEQERTAIRIEGGSRNVVKDNVSIGYDEIVSIKNSRENLVSNNLGIGAKRQINELHQNQWLVTILGGIIAIIIGGMLLFYIFGIH